MTLSQWLTHLETLHPNEIELGLDRIRQVADKLTLDFSQQQVVIVGGTNGKGSTISLLSSILSAAGYRVGSYTSPHLIKYNERVCINNINVSDDELCEAFVTVEAAREGTELTYFEFGTLAALVLFTHQELDYILLEVGLGGRLDAVNILDADLAVLTNVALDHTDWLGETREEIGYEKAGIYRSHCPALFGESSIPESVVKQINKIGAIRYLADNDFSWSCAENGQSWAWSGMNQAGDKVSLNNLPLKNFALNYALSNAALVIQAVSLLNSSITKNHIIQGLQNVTLEGRFQRIQRKQMVILDVAHNPHAAKNLLKNLQSEFPKRQITIVMAMLRDKDIEQVLSILKPVVRNWYIGEIQADRGTPAKIIYNYLQQLGVAAVSCYSSVDAAFAAAEAEAKAEDVILVTGSFYTVSTVLGLL